MRFDTVKISAYLVYLIQGQRPRMQVIDDGGDIIHVRLASGESIMLYLIENDITDYEIKNIINANSAKHIHSLFVLWCDLLLPRHGMYYLPDPFMATLLALHGDKIYAYDAYGMDVFVFPIHFEGTGVARDIRYGAAVDASLLSAKRVKTAYAPGLWYSADFEVSAYSANPMQRYFDILGINLSTDRALIKRTYRHLARTAHPDMHIEDADMRVSTIKMQQINEAYTKILAHLDTLEAEANK